jgi:hypothetical protein
MSVIQRPLFPMPASTTGVERGEWIDKGISGRAKVRIALGKHPLECVQPGLNLHPDASRDPEDRAPGPRCGTCRFAVAVTWHNKRYNKCGYPNAALDDDAARASHSEQTDLRLWWPACMTYEPNENGETHV